MKEMVYIDQARQGRKSFWRFVATLVFIIALNIIVTIFLLGLAVYFYNTIDFRAMPEWFVLIVGMLPFGVTAVGLWIAIKLFHLRSFRSLLTSAGSFRWRLVFLSAGVWIGLTVLSDIIMVLLRPGNVYWSFDAGRFIPFLLVALVLVPIQAATEELIFRGYLTQAFGLLGARHLAGVDRSSSHVWPAAWRESRDRSIWLQHHDGLLHWNGSVPGLDHSEK
jgi:uncharacterized protein